MNQGLIILRLTRSLPLFLALALLLGTCWPHNIHWNKTGILFVMNNIAENSQAPNAAIQVYS